MTKLNLGCGQNKLDGYINVDKFETCAPDIVWDLEVTPWPFESDSADEVVMSHCLEHMGATPPVFFAIMKELYRVAKRDARVVIAVPHPRSDNFISDPTHVRPITLETIHLFSKQKNIEWREKQQANSPLALYLDVDFELTDLKYGLEADWNNRYQQGKITIEEVAHAIKSFNNVVDEIRFTLAVRK